MTDVTQVGVIESKQAIWDYDPTLEENRVVSGGLDVIAVIRTLAIKVSSSVTRITLLPCASGARVSLHKHLPPREHPCIMPLRQHLRLPARVPASPCASSRVSLRKLPRLPARAPASFCASTCASLRELPRLPARAPAHPHERTRGTRVSPERTRASHKCTRVSPTPTHVSICMYPAPASARTCPVRAPARVHSLTDGCIRFRHRRSGRKLSTSIKSSVGSTSRS